MKNINWIHVLICLFVFRIIAMSASFPDALCLIALLGFKFADRYVKAKNIADGIIKDVVEAKEESRKARESVDTVRLSTGFSARR